TLLLAGAAGAAALGALLYALAHTPPVVAPLHAVVSGTGRGATQDPLWFGPSRTDLALELLDVPAAELGEVRLTVAPGPGSAAVSGWRLTVRDDRRLELAAEPGATRRTRAFLVLESEHGRQASEPLELVFVE